MKMGTAQPNVNAEKLKELLIPFCNIEIQKSIIQENDDFSDNQIIKSYDKINSLQSLISSQLDLLKKYRQAILQDAIQGKLVKQDKNDEPASVLLEKIKKEKQKLITEGKLKADKELTPIHPDEVPFEIPKNWVWCRLGDVSLKVQDGTHFSPSMQYDVPEKNRFLYITSKNIKDYGIEMFGATYIDKETHESIYQRCNVEKGDLLIIKDGAITGRVTINNIDEPFSLLSSVAFVKSFNQYIDNKYIMYYLRSDVGREKIIGRMTGSAMPRIILEKIKSTILPLPPLAEQKRIVARVDELMTLCDTMEGKLKEDKALSEKMMEAVLQEAFGVKDNDIIRQDVKKR
jgi:type I restriction enzyme S subunit